MSTGDVAETVLGVTLFGGLLAANWVRVLRRAAHRERASRREHSRAGRAYDVALEAAEDDPGFAPDVIEQSIDEAVVLAGRLWRNETPHELDDRPDAPLLRAWASSRQAWLGTGLEAVGKPSVDLLVVVNRNNEEENRVVARIRLRVHCGHPRTGAAEVHLDERWTLGQSECHWVLLSVGGDPLAGPLLTAPLIPTRSSDTKRLQEESLAEIAGAQQANSNVALSDLIDPGAPPALALLDLSLVEPRFSPPLIAADIAHLLEAWQDAATGSEAPFERLTSEEARVDLLQPQLGARLILQDVVLKSWEVTRLHLSKQPPSVEVTLEVEAVHYLVTDSGAYVVGSLKRPRYRDVLPEFLEAAGLVRARKPTDPRRIVMTWELELTNSSQVPWRLIASSKSS